MTPDLINFIGVFLTGAIVGAFIGYCRGVRTGMTYSDDDWEWM